MPPIILCRGPGEQSGRSIGGTRHPAGDRQTCRETLYIPLERSRERFVEIIDIEDWRSLRCRIGTEIRKVAVAAGVGALPCCEASQSICGTA